MIASALLLGLWLITASLRPLRRIEETAAAIGAGDLSRRVEPDGGTTEIGRLGGALNAMLGQIEDAFAERSASEARLRRFISDASHELRTPIAAVSAYAELFDRGARDRPADLERSMTGIQRETRRMGLLVGDLLLLARLDQGRPLESRPVDLTALAGDAVDAAHAMEPDRPLALEAPAAVTVTGDAERLRQVVDNLLANVRAHTPADAAAIVRVRREGESAVLEVEDAGPGLAAEQAAHVFERFYRGDPSRSRDHGGAGLGLAIVAAIVQAHGGSVGLESAPGAGTTFRVTLPDRTAVPEGELARSPVGGPDRSTPARCAGRSTSRRSRLRAPAGRRRGCRRARRRYPSPRAPGPVSAAAARCARRPAGRPRSGSTEERLGERVVLARHGPELARGLGQRDGDDIVAAQGRHHAVARRQGELGGEQAVARREHAVVGGRRAAALQVAERRHARLEAGHLLERVGELLADAAEAHVPERVELAGRRRDLAGAGLVRERPALADDDDREVPAAAVARADEVGAALDGERELGDQHDVGAARDAARDGEPARRGGP